MTYSEFKKLLLKAGLAALLCVAALYGADDLLLRYLAAGHNARGGLGSVTVYPAATMKSGKQEIYFDQPETKTCVNSLFPHMGWSPCWYAQRSMIRNVTFLRRLAPVERDARLS